MALNIATTIQRVAELTNDGVMVTEAEPLSSPGPVIVYVNPAFTRLTGYPAAEVIGRTPRMFQGPATDRAALDRIAEALRNGRSVQEEIVNYRRDGTPFWQELAIHPVRDAAGRINHFLSIQHDITARKEWELKLAASERRLSEAQRIAGLGWWEFDLRTRTVSGSDHFFEIMGCPRPDDAMSVDRIRDTIHPDDLGLVREAFRSGSPTLSLQFRARLSNGEVRHVLTEATVEHSPDGVPIRGFGVTTDITDRVLANEALRAAKEQAEEANVAKSRFLAAASHDLRQPLNAMSLLLGVLRNRSSSRETLDLADQLQHSLDAMMELFNALLDISRFETGAVEVRRGPVRVDHLFHRIQVDFAGAARAKGLNLRVVDAVGSVWSDPMLLERILRNLVANAIRYTSEGRVLVGCRRRGRNLRIDVLDTGSGIPPGQMKIIFEEFHQVGNAARQRHEGYGLGLAIVKRAADLLGHRVEVTSVLGKGSRFSIEVPALPDTVTTPETGPMERCKTQPGDHCPVLVVEDDPLVSIAMRMMLEELGCTVLSAGTGAEAEDVVRAANAPPCLVIADFRLPGNQDGIDTVTRVRALSPLPIAAGIVTGDLAPEIQKRAAYIGARCLTKPIRPEDLKALVDLALSDAAD